VGRQPGSHALECFLEACGPPQVGARRLDADVQEMGVRVHEAGQHQGTAGVVHREPKAAGFGFDGAAGSDHEEMSVLP
jgi:hypothetical protein